MAECTHPRCLQERRHIKRELMKWSKDMLYICGLERVAEELMGRRKWKQYQEALSRSQLSADITNLDQIDISNQKYEAEQKLEKAKENSHQPQQQQPFENDVPKIKTEVIDVNERTSISPHIKKENFESNSVVTEGSIKLNNNTTTSHSIHNNNSKKDNEELLPPPTSPTPPPSIPIDWTPNEKCNYCVDGKLLTVNEKGELVAESSPALSEADLANRPPGDTDSDSSDSLVPDARVNASKVLTPRLRESVPPNMTSFESMAAQWTAINSLPGLPSSLGQFYPSILYNLTQQVNSATPTTSETSAAAISPSLKGSPSPSDLTGEQPLDLSSKPSPNSSIGGDARHVHRAKPRVTPCTGRRAYTEEELNNALQDIMSGRLGTRRAAVQYNIPRSTLRNKVYKISSGAKRETPTSLHHPVSLEDLADVDDDKQDLSADEEDSSGDKFPGSSLASHVGDDLASRFADANLAASIQKICAEQNSLTSQHQQQHQQQQHHQPHSDIHIHNKPTTSLESQPKRKASTPQPPPPQTSPHHHHNILQSAMQTVLLQRSLLSGGIHQNIEETVIQMLNALLMNQDPSLINPQLLMQLQQPQRSPQSAQQQHQQHLYPSNAAGHPSTAAAVAAAAAAASFQNRQPKSETPETASSVDLNETLGDDPSVILKIPSFKPVAGSSTISTSSAAAAVAAAAAAALCNNKNGENLPSSSPKTPTASALLGANTSTQHHHHHLHQHHNPSAANANNIPGMSSPLIRHASGESQSPPTLSLREVIANSISRTFSQQANKDATSPSPAHSSSSALDHNDQYKRPSISVIKNIGGTDTSRFATAPNLLGGHHNSNHHHQQHHHHQHHSQNAANNNLAGGKGTRPKRGKYRNYDRDSLVEAVKAVQRGEMSVHRAGSYYGVPHSTLEYKVKERHLMRPRKREPKPQPPLDDRTGGGNSSSNTSGSMANTSKNSNIPGLSAVNSLDKLSKSSGAAGNNQKQSAAGKSNPPFPTTSPNGMKIPPTLFEPGLAAQMSYPPQLFWPGGFGHLPMDFNSRSQAAAAVAAAATASGAGNPSFAAANAELFKSQMMQRFHEDRGASNAIGSPPAPASLSNSTTSSSTNNTKSVREIAENIYDTTGANGSFLDGIIRKTLDRKSSDITQGALLDQLVKNSKPPPQRLMMSNERTTGDLLKLKRSGSPMPFHTAMEIKRERASPTSDSSNSDSERNHNRDTDSEPPASHHSLGLHHALLNVSGDLNGAQHGLAAQLTASENNMAASSSSAVTTSILHDKLGQIKSETDDSL